MRCVHCGHENPETSKFCAGCQARLLQKAPEGMPPTAGLEIVEGREYPPPPRNYETRYILELFEVVEAYLEGEAEPEEVEEELKAHEARLEVFESQTAPDMLNLLGQEKRRFPDDNFNTHVAYLINKGMTLYREGLGALGGALETGEEEAMLAACERLQEANNHICYSLELSAERQAELEKLLEHHPQKDLT